MTKPGFSTLNYTRPHSPAPSSHLSSDLASTPSGSIQSCSSFDRLSAVVSSLDPSSSSDSDDGLPIGKKKQKKKKFRHALLSNLSRHSQSVATDHGGPPPKKPKTKKEAEDKKERRLRREFEGLNVVERVFASRVEGKFAPFVDKWRAGKVPAGKAPTGEEERKVKAWGAKDKVTEKLRVKSREEEDAAAAEKEIAKRTQEWLKKRTEKLEEKRKDRTEKRIYDAFMNEPLAHNFVYPSQYADLYKTAPTMPDLYYDSRDYDATWQPTSSDLSPRLGGPANLRDQIRVIEYSIKRLEGETETMEEATMQQDPRSRGHQEGSYLISNKAEKSSFDERFGVWIDAANEWLLQNQLLVAGLLIGFSILFFVFVDAQPTPKPKSKLQPTPTSTGGSKLGEVDMSALKDDVQLDPPKETPFTTGELGKYDGSVEGKPIYVAIKGQIFDVSAKKEMYGPGGGYHIFAGKDGSRGLGKSSLKPEDALSDYSTLDESEVTVLNDWVKYFTKRYNIIGKVVD